jgi:transcriptional regulator with XRE-family HTH domain
MVTDADEFYLDIGARLLDERHFDEALAKRGKGRAWLGRALGVGQSTVWLWCRQRRSPSPEHMRAMASILGTSVAYLSTSVISPLNQIDDDDPVPEQTDQPDTLTQDSAELLPDPVPPKREYVQFGMDGMLMTAFRRETRCSCGKVVDP